MPHMVLIIFSPISSHKKQKEREKSAIIKHTHSLPMRGACVSLRRAEKLGITEKDQCPGIWEGRGEETMLEP